MNGVRSIFRRKGYLLTALAAAVLLAASSGTAWAQTLTGFDKSTVTVTEPTAAEVTATTSPSVEVTVTKSGTAAELTATYGEITLNLPDAVLTVVDAADDTNTPLTDPAVLTFLVGDGDDQEEVDEITFTITAAPDGADGNWLDEAYELSLTTDIAGTRATSSLLVVMVNDAQKQPVANFARSSLTLNEDNSAIVGMSVDAEDLDLALASLTAEDHTLMVMVEPAEALDDGPITIMFAGNAVDVEDGSFPVGTVNGLADDEGLTIMAIADLSENTIPAVTLSFMSLTTDLGEIKAGDPLTINLPSAVTPTTTQAGDIGIKSVKVDAADSAGKVNEGTTTMVTVTLTEDWPAATAAEITLKIMVPKGTGGEKGNAELAASTTGGPVDLLLGSMNLAVNKDQDEVSIALLVNDDLDAVGEKFEILATLTAVDDVTDAGNLTGNFSGSIVDDETQTYEFEVKTDDDEILEDDNVEVTLKAKPNRPLNEDVKIFLQAPKGYKAVPSEVDLTAASTLQTIKVETPKNDKNRTDDVITLNAVTGSVVSNKVVGTSESITVLDIHQLPTDISGEANGADEDGKETDAVVTMVAEGGKAFLYVTVVNEDSDDDRISDEEDFTVTPTLSGSQVLDARIMPTNMKISDGEESGDETVVGPFTIEAVTDEDIGMEALTVSLDVTGEKAYGPGTSSGTFSINIEDGTEPLVFVEDGAYEAIMAALGGAVTQGATVTIMTGDLFGTAEGYTASFGAAVEGNTISASASGESFTLTASEDMTGESKVTVTATARMMGSSFIPSQTVSNVAEIVFPVMVEAVEPVPALPLLGQLLLALFMMAGGARLYRRRQG